jgi:hypothetical protein
MSALIGAVGAGMTRERAPQLLVQAKGRSGLPSLGERLASGKHAGLREIAAYG